MKKQKKYKHYLSFIHWDYETGLSVSEMVEKYNIPETTLRRYLKEYDDKKELLRRNLLIEKGIMRARLKTAIIQVLLALLISSLLFYIFTNYVN